MHTINLFLIFHTQLFLYNGIILLHVLLLLLNISACAIHGQQLLKKGKINFGLYAYLFYLLWMSRYVQRRQGESFILTIFYSN